MKKLFESWRKYVNEGPLYGFPKGEKFDQEEEEWEKDSLWNSIGLYDEDIDRFIQDYKKLGFEQAVKNNIPYDGEKTIAYDIKDQIVKQIDGIGIKGQKGLQMVKEEEEEDTIIGIPGGFKPPHKGHVAMINHYLEKFPKAKVMIYMGSKPRRDSTNSMEFGIKQSKKVFKLYFQKGVLDPSRVKLKDKIKQRPKKTGGHYESPMADIMELVGDMSLAGSRVGMGYAEKEKDYGSKFIKGSEKFSSGAKAFDPGPAEWGTSLQGISATKMRNAIKNQNLKTISEMIPDGISPEEYLALFK